MNEATAIAIVGEIPVNVMCLFMDIIFCAHHSKEHTVDLRILTFTESILIFLLLRMSIMEGFEIFRFVQKQ